MSAVLEPSSEVSAPRGEIHRFMIQRISRYLSSSDDTSLYQSVRKISQFISDDYGNRFLVELIQNAHDAHEPSSSDGEIAIVLRPTEGQNGCLYVANRGNGFDGRNLNAITNIALSSKPVNAGIGNKGIGFRSVLQICHWPEIYSVLGEGGSGVFDGYCFRFATEDDLREYVPGTSIEIAREMADNMPCWHVPVPVEPDEHVARFAAEGFATVVRLPLKKGALQAVRAQMDALLALDAPLHLFLERIRSISIDRGTGVTRVLSRSVSNASTFFPPGFNVDSPVKVATVRLDSAEFIIAHWDMDEATFKTALQASLDKNEVPESWKEWEGAARVSVAVPLGAPLDAGRLYCFLPLGEEGAAPFAGYLNANFYTKMDRRKVDESLGLNGCLLQTGAWLSCQLIGYLVEHDMTHAANAVVSLLCWEERFLDSFKYGMGDKGRGVLNHAFLPVRGPAGVVAWASPGDTYAWTFSHDACLSPQQVCEVGGGRILIDSLTSSQRAALERLYVNLRGRGFRPPAVVVAEWIERIAERMREDGARPERWATFYDEVSVAMADNASLLFGRRILLNTLGDLISSEPPSSEGPGRNRKAADVYFSPILSANAEVDDNESKQWLPLQQLPTNLRKGFALLSREVPWLKEDGGHRPGRSFLVAGKLVREYDTGDVLRTLSKATREAHDDRSRGQALEWAFRLWNSRQSLSDKETRAADFHVPAADGWIAARTAMFGAGWQVANGKALQTLLHATASQSDDLARSLARLLPDFDAWPISYGGEHDWIRFLDAAGVMKCLRPVGGETVVPASDVVPRYLPDVILNAASECSAALHDHWRALLKKDCAVMHSTIKYRALTQAWRMPGQFEFGAFSPEIRRDYAVQVVLAIRSLEDEHWFFRAIRPSSGGGARDAHRLSTPLRAFVTGAEWVPVVRTKGSLRFVKPTNAWWFTADDAHQPPRFLDFVVGQVVRVTDDTTLDWLQKHAGIGVFNDARHAGRALLALAQAASAPITEIRDVRVFRERFRQLWSLARQEGQPPTAPCVPVAMNGRISVVSRAGGESVQAYFDDGNDGLEKQLFVELGEPIFDFVQEDNGAVWDWLNASAPGRYRRISDEHAEVYIDGRKLDGDTPGRLLSEIAGSWFVDFLVCVAEHKSGSFVQATQRTLAKIRRAALTLTVIDGRKIEIAHDGRRIMLPPSLRGALVLKRAAGPVLVMQTTGGPLTLDHLSRATGQLAAALGAKELAHGLEAALLRVSSALVGGQFLEEPDDEIIARALGIDTDAIGQTRRLASGDLFGMLHLAIPLAGCKGMHDIMSQLQAIGAQEDAAEEALHPALESLATQCGMSLTVFEAQMTQLVDLPDLKDAFELPIAELNAVIETLGNPYKPVSNEQQHRHAWACYLRGDLPSIHERLRSRACSTFDRLEPLEAYVAARTDAVSLPPDPEWFTKYDQIPEELMATKIDRWIEDAFPNAAAQTSIDCSLAEARDANSSKLRDFLTRFSPILSAWARARATGTTAAAERAWLDLETARVACTAKSKSNGWLDFRLLDDDGIAGWLTLEGFWPQGRAAIADLAVWGLSAEKMAANEERLKATRAEQQRRRHEVEFGDGRLLAQTDRYAEIAAAVAAALDQASALNDVSSQDAPLKNIDAARPSGHAHDGSRKAATKSPESAMSDEQKRAVGLIGELWAREWLRRRHNLECVDENIWVSGYRDNVLNTSGGCDSLGYDFIVETKSRTHYYEVKASTGDPGRFELGPTEIVTAQRYRGDREHRYRILYLSNVGDPARLTFTLLTNPFSAKADGKFRLVGKGSVTYEFIA